MSGRFGFKVDTDFTFDSDFEELDVGKATCETCSYKFCNFEKCNDKCDGCCYKDCFCYQKCCP